MTWVAGRSAAALYRRAHSLRLAARGRANYYTPHPCPRPKPGPLSSPQHLCSLSLCMRRSRIPEPGAGGPSTSSTSRMTAMMAGSFWTAGDRHHKDESCSRVVGIINAPKCFATILLSPKSLICPKDGCAAPRHPVHRWIRSEHHRPARIILNSPPPAHRIFPTPRKPSPPFPISLHRKGTPPLPCGLASTPPRAPLNPERCGAGLAGEPGLGGETYGPFHPHCLPRTRRRGRRRRARLWQEKPSTSSPSPDGYGALARPSGPTTPTGASTRELPIAATTSPSTATARGFPFGEPFPAWWSRNDNGGSNNFVLHYSMDPLSDIGGANPSNVAGNKITCRL